MLELRKRFAKVKDARVVVAPSSPVPGVSTSGGFRLMVQDRGGLGLPTLQDQTDRFIRKVKEQIGEEVQAAPEERHAAVLQPQVRHLVAHRHQALVQEALERRRVHDLHLHGRVQPLPDPRRREQHVRADLADVVQRGLGLLGEVDGEADGQGGGHGHHLLADPGEREEGDELVRRLARVHLVQAERHGEQVVE